VTIVYVLLLMVIPDGTHDFNYKAYIAPVSQEYCESRGKGWLDKQDPKNSPQYICIRKTLAGEYDTGESIPK
jgi:hypothetical protein